MNPVGVLWNNEGRGKQLMWKCVVVSLWNTSTVLSVTCVWGHSREGCSTGRTGDPSIIEMRKKNYMDSDYLAHNHYWAIYLSAWSQNAINFWYSSILLQAKALVRSTCYSINWRSNQYSILNWRTRNQYSILNRRRSKWYSILNNSLANRSMVRST